MIAIIRFHSSEYYLGFSPLNIFYEKERSYEFKQFYTSVIKELTSVSRYMKNDLNRLQLCCRNRERGCEMVCSLESIDRHEHECEYSQVACPNAGRLNSEMYFFLVIHYYIVNNEGGVFSLQIIHIFLELDQGFQ